MPTIFVLAYNGGTTDTRVMKQARSLAGAGYDVHLFCNVIEGHPSKDEVDGVHVHRFPTFSTAGANRCDLTMFDFMENAAVELRTAIAALTSHEESKVTLRGRIEQLDEIKTLISARPLEKTYKQYKGAKRLRRRLLYLISRLRRGGDPAAGQKAHRRLSELRSVLGAELRELRGRSDEIAEWRFRARYGLFSFNLHMYSCNLGAMPPRPDIIHAHDLYTLPAAICLAKRFGARVVYDAHEIEIERFPPMSPHRKSFVDRLERDCLADIDALVTVSEGCGAFYRQRFTKRVPAIVMNIPEQIRTRSYRGPTLRARLGLPADVPLIVFTGAVGKADRGVDKLVEAMASLPNYHLAVLGPRHKVNDPWLMGCVDACGVGNRVHLLEPVAPEHVVAAIQSADVAVCAHQDFSLNYRHAMPNKLFEAATAGIPICVSDLPDMRAFVEELGIGVSMDQADPAAIAAALETIIKAPHNFRGHQQTASLLERKYSWAAQAQTIFDLYQELLTDRHAAGMAAQPRRVAVDARPSVRPAAEATQLGMAGKIAATP